MTAYDPSDVLRGDSMGGFIILSFGLLFALVAVFSFTQGLRDLFWLTFLLGVIFIFGGYLIYKKGKRRRFINKRQVARLFGVTKSTIDRWLQDGKLPKPQRRFGLRKWDREDLVMRLKRKP